MVSTPDVGAALSAWRGAIVAGMTWMQDAPITGVTRRRESIDLAERPLRRAVESGALVRIAPGSFVPRAAWEGAAPDQRHAQRVWEAAARVEPGTVFSHFAAAAVLGIDILGPWPTRIDVSHAETGGGRSSGLMKRHARRGSLDVVPWGEHFVTTPAQTALDIAAASPFVQGVVAVDQALRTNRPGGALISPETLLNAASRYSGRGGARARRAAEFGDGGAANVRESHSRVLIHTLGFPAPVLQHRFVLSDGRFAYTDFWWPRYRVAGELDGMQKYLDPRMLNGKTPYAALAAEKDRENELRRLVRVVARWRVPDLDAPHRLWDILVGAGLPTLTRRPAA